MESKCPFVIAIDSREQQPFSFEGITVGKNKTPIIILAQVATLQQGDYSIVGFENRVAIERKSCKDLVSTVAHNRDRFERELARLQQLDFAAVIVEDLWQNVMHWAAIKTGYNPASLDSSILAWNQRFRGVHWYWRPGRYAAAKSVWKILDRWYRDERRRAKKEV